MKKLTSLTLVWDSQGTSSHAQVSIWASTPVRSLLTKSRVRLISALRMFFYSNLIYAVLFLFFYISNLPYSYFYFFICTFLLLSLFYLSSFPLPPPLVSLHPSSYSFSHPYIKARVCLGHYASAGLKDPLRGRDSNKLVGLEVTDYATIRYRREKVCVCVCVCLSVCIFLSILVIYLLWSEICYSCIRLPFFLPWPSSYLPRPPSFPTFLRRLASFQPSFLPFLDSFLPSFFGLLSYLPSFLHFFLGFLPCVSFFLGFHPWLPSLASFLLLEITFYLNFMTTSLIKSLNSVSTDLMIIIFHPPLFLLPLLLHFFLHLSSPSRW